MKSRLIGATSTCLLLLGIATGANGALVSRLGGQAIYDNDLNITWLADANYAETSGYDDDGTMTWDVAIEWADQLVFGGYSDWRLPTTSDTCSGFSCTSSEMGHLFYNELGGIADSSILTSSDPDLALFSNIIQSNYYWSGTEYPPDPTHPGLYAWDFYFGLGFQSTSEQNNHRSAWAVRTGDIATVPVPTAIWLFGSGLFGVTAFLKNIKSK